MSRGCSTLAVLLGGMLWLGLAGQSGLAQSSAPALRLVSSNQTERVFWPTSAYYYLLQSTTNLANNNSWVNEVSASLMVSWFSSENSGGSAGLATDTSSNQFFFAQTKLPVNKFYRLKTPDYFPLCSFAVFYDGLLEFSQCPTMLMNGAVHANGSINLGTSASLTFNYPVSCTGQLAAPFVEGFSLNWVPTNPATWNVTYNGNPTVITNMLRIPLWPTTNSFHFVIDVPPAGEDPSTFPGAARLFNQAQMILLVTNVVSGAGNPTVQLTLQASVNGNVPGSDPAKVVYIYTNQSPSALSTNFPFLSLTNLTYDQREYKTNLITQIDIGKFAGWIQTNVAVQGKLPALGGIFPTILFVADQRNHSATQLPSVRLVNGAQLPANNNFGFTVDTPNPLYVLGNYNVQTASSAANASAATVNTAYTVPAALFCDALTVLSPHWTDAESFNTFDFNNPTMDAADETINAAIITGTMPTTANTPTGFSGGVHNLPRLLEDWVGVNLWLNTSLIRLWNSQMATNQFRIPPSSSPPSVNPYYRGPTRHFNFDQNFLNPAKIPPGIPLLTFSTNSP